MQLALFQLRWNLAQCYLQNRPSRFNTSTYDYHDYDYYDNHNHRWPHNVPPHFIVELWFHDTLPVLSNAFVPPDH